MVGPSDFCSSVFCYLSCHQHLLLCEPLSGYELRLPVQRSCLLDDGLNLTTLSYFSPPTLHASLFEPCIMWGYFNYNSH